MAPERSPIRFACSKLSWNDFFASPYFPPIIGGKAGGGNVALVFATLGLNGNGAGRGKLLIGGNLLSSSVLVLVLGPVLIVPGLELGPGVVLRLRLRFMFSWLDLKLGPEPETLIMSSVMLVGV